MATPDSVFTCHRLAPMLLAIALFGCSADDLDSPSVNGISEPPATETPAPQSVMAPAMSFNRTLLGDMLVINVGDDDTAPPSISASLACLAETSDAVFRLADAFFMQRQLRPDDSVQVIGADLLDAEPDLLEEIIETLVAIPVAVFLADQVDCHEGTLPRDNLAQMIDQIKQDMQGNLDEETIAEISALFDALLSLQISALARLDDEPRDTPALAAAIEKLARLMSLAHPLGEDEGESSFEDIFVDGEERLPFFPDIFLVGGLVGQHIAQQIAQLGQFAQMDALIAGQLPDWASAVATQLLPLSSYETIYSDSESWPDGDTVLAAIDALREEAAALTDGDLLVSQQLDADSIDQTLNEALLDKVQALMTAINETEPAAPASCGDNLPLLGPLLCLVTDSLVVLLGITSEELATLFEFLTN